MVAGLVVMNSLNFCLFGKVFISPSFVKDNFATRERSPYLWVWLLEDDLWVVCVPLIPPSLTSCLQVEILFMGPIYGSVFFQPFLATPTLCFLLPLVAEFLSLCIFSWFYNTPGQILIAFLLVSQVQCEGSRPPLAHKFRPTFCVYSLAVCQSLLLLLLGVSTVSQPPGAGACR